MPLCLCGGGENDLQGPVLSFHQGGPGEVCRSGASVLNPLSRLTNPAIFSRVKMIALCDLKDSLGTVLVMGSNDGRGLRSHCIHCQEAGRGDSPGSTLPIAGLPRLHRIGQCIFL